MSIISSKYASIFHTIRMTETHYLFMQVCTRIFLKDEPEVIRCSTDTDATFIPSHVFQVYNHFLKLNHKVVLESLESNQQLIGIFLINSKLFFNVYVVFFINIFECCTSTLSFLKAPVGDCRFYWRMKILKY